MLPHKIDIGNVRRSCDAMVTAITDKPGNKRQHKVLVVGRRRLVMLARHLARQKPAKRSPEKAARYKTEMSLLIKMCQAQYILRRRDLARRRRNLAGWAKEPEQPRPASTKADLIARANRVAAAASAPADLATELRGLLVSARHQPPAQTQRPQQPASQVKSTKQGRTSPRVSNPKKPAPAPRRNRTRGQRPPNAPQNHRTTRSGG